MNPLSEFISDEHGLTVQITSTEIVQLTSEDVSVGQMIVAIVLIVIHSQIIISSLIVVVSCVVL
jgi:hypothetical protein